MKPVRELFILEDHDCNYKIFPDINLAYDYVVEYIKENHNEEDAKELLAELEANIPVCTVSEAVMYMDLNNEAALMFKNTATGNFNMVYRRKDGNIGWVEPK